MSNVDSRTTVLERQRSISDAELRLKADWIRLRTIDLIDIAGSGHYSSVFSCAELFADLFYRTMRLDPTCPDWSDRDRFVMGKGHAAIGLYPVLADLGFYPESILDDYARLGSPFGDHPDMRKIPGIDFSSGSIGHNLSVGVGMALGGRKLGKDFRVFAMLGDGEMHEGQVWEGAMAAAHFKLGNLVALIDRNQMCLDGYANDVMGIEPLAEKWRAFGWRVIGVNGHDVNSLRTTFDNLHDPSDKTPTCVIADTRKGAGVSFMDLSLHWHLGYLGPKDRQAARDEIQQRMAEGGSLQ